MTECMEEILRSAFANLLKEVSDPHKIHAAIIEDYKEIYKTGIYASTMKDPKTKKKTSQREDARKRIDSILEITTDGVDKPTVVVKETDSSSIHLKFKLDLESLQKRADLDSKRVEEAKKAKETLTRELSVLTAEKSTDASKKLEASDENDVREKQRRKAELEVEINIKRLIITEAEYEKSKTDEIISKKKALLLATEKELSQKSDTSKTKEAPRITHSRRNSGAIFLFLSNEILFLMFVSEYFGQIVCLSKGNFKNDFHSCCT